MKQGVFTNLKLVDLKCPQWEKWSCTITEWSPDSGVSLFLGWHTNLKKNNELGWNFVTVLKTNCLTFC